MASVSSIVLNAIKRGGVLRAKTELSRSTPAIEKAALAHGPAPKSRIGRRSRDRPAGGGVTSPRRRRRDPSPPRHRRCGGRRRRRGAAATRLRRGAAASAPPQPSAHSPRFGPRAPRRRRPVSAAAPRAAVSAAAPPPPPRLAFGPRTLPPGATSTGRRSIRAHVRLAHWLAQPYRRFSDARSTIRKTDKTFSARAGHVAGLPRGHSVKTESRRRRGCHVDIP